jgi:hypothetical protein
MVVKKSGGRPLGDLRFGYHYTAISAQDWIGFKTHPSHTAEKRKQIGKILKMYLT